MKLLFFFFGDDIIETLLSILDIVVDRHPGASRSHFHYVLQSAEEVQVLVVGEHFDGCMGVLYMGAPSFVVNMIKIFFSIERWSFPALW